MIDFLQKNGIEGREEDNGRMLIASNKARDLLNFLLEKNTENATEIQYNTKVEKIKKADQGYSIHTSQGELHCKRLIIATGGQSFPKV